MSPSKRMHLDALRNEISRLSVIVAPVDELRNILQSWSKALVPDSRKPKSSAISAWYRAGHR